MASHRAQAQFERARWRLFLVVPLWALQLGLTLSLVGLFSYRLGDSIKHYEDREELEEMRPKLELIWESTNVGMSAIATLCTLFEIARYVGEALTPWTMLFTHIVKLSCAGGVLALDIVVHLQGIDKQYSIIGLALDGALILTATVLAIYAIIAYRRLSAFDDHPHTVNAKAYGFSDGMERRSSYTAMLGTIRPSMEKRISSTSSRLSLSSNKRRHSEPESIAMNDVGRGQNSYSHERDTQFDEYVARRGSSPPNPNGLVDVERALGSEFGWDRPYGTSTKYHGGLNRGSDEQYESQDQLVSIGMVKSRPRGASMPRAPSMTSDHVLVSVPEEDDHEDVDRGARDRQALLGGDSRRSEELDGLRVPQEVDMSEPRWQRE